MQTFVDKLLGVLDAGAWLERFAAWLPSAVAAVGIYIGFYLLWRVARRTAAIITRRAHLDDTAVTFLQTMLKYVILTVGVVTALGKVGVNTASLLTSLGIAGLTIGFAARDALSNMISGLFIFWDRPFVLGDLVEIGGHYGRVAEITMRSTRVVTPDGRMLAVPNTTIVNSTVASYTNFPHLRLDVPFTVAVHEDLGKVRRTVLAVCEGRAELLTEPAPVVVVTALNDYNVTLELNVWLDNERDHIAARVLIREQLFEALRSAQIDMPFETFALAPVEVRQSQPTA